MGLNGIVSLNRIRNGLSLNDDSEKKAFFDEVGGRAEQSTKVIGFGFVNAHGHHGIDRIYSNGGRAEI